MIYINAKFLTKRITGVERYAFELACALMKNHPDITLLSPPNVLKNNIEKGVNFKKIGTLKNYFWEQLELPYYLSKINSPLLINPTNTAPILYSNQILFIHDLAFIHNPGWYTKRAAAAFKFLVTRSVKASKRIITVSNFSKQEITKYLNVPPDKIDVVYGAIPGFIEEYLYYESNNSYGGYILTVSSLEPRKNIDALLKAFIRLNRPDIKLLIVGDANRTVFNKIELDKNNIRENIIFLGYVPDRMLVHLYKNALLFAYLSYYEGFGFPPLEAISCGCQTLVANSSSLPEICGIAAHYCESDDIEDISEKMGLILEGKLKIDSSSMKEWAKNYNWDVSAKKVLKIASEL